jgi:hypothetical protein
MSWVIQLAPEQMTELTGRYRIAFDDRTIDIASLSLAIVSVS